MRKAACFVAMVSGLLICGAALRAERILRAWRRRRPRLPGKNSLAWRRGISWSAIRSPELAEYYAADGTVKSMLGNQISTGQWALVGDTVCFKYPDEEIDCYKLEVIGNTVTMTDSTGEGTRYEILKGNPKSL